MAAVSAALARWLWSPYCSLIEALAEGRSKAQANSPGKTGFCSQTARTNMALRRMFQDQLRKGDIVLVAGDIIPCDGEVTEGGASVDERHHRGISTVIRESGGDFACHWRHAVLSDWLRLGSVNSRRAFLDG